MKFNLGDYDLGDLGLGDFSLGDLGLGDFNLGDFNLGDFDLIPRLIHKTDIALHPEIDLVMTKKLLFHNTPDHDMTTINEIHDPTALLTDLLTDPLTGMTLVIDIDHVHIQEMTTLLQDTHLHIDHLHHHEILHILEHVRYQIKETNLIQYNHKPKMIQLISKYTCITQLKWQTL